MRPIIRPGKGPGRRPIILRRISHLFAAPHVANNLLLRSAGRCGAVLRKARLWQRINRRPVNDRQRLVINRMLGGFEGFLSTSKYASLAKCSPDTALRDIRELLDRHILVQNPSGGRSTSYRLAEPEHVAGDS